eukprot:GHVQ01023751.1.p1 GENE.GHVQ01023751.1~~GHVQ01023751.1.p1  ORF type:complete len:488 (+),score=38.16 GHVQ01023751.1:75-1538(+)
MHVHKKRQKTATNPACSAIDFFDVVSMDPALGCSCVVKVLSVLTLVCFLSSFYSASLNTHPTNRKHPLLDALSCQEQHGQNRHLSRSKDTAALSSTKNSATTTKTSRGIDADKGADKIFKSAKDYLPISGIDHVEIYCSNAKQAAYWYCGVLGFKPLAYAGLETGIRDRTSYAVQQGNIRLVLTSSLVPDGAIADHVKLHGDGVKVISLTSPDSRRAYEEAMKRGATRWMAPTEMKDKDGAVVMSGINTFGDTVHAFVERNAYRGLFLPGFRAWSFTHSQQGDVGLTHIDHMVANVEKGKMDKWCKFYETVFGMTSLISFDDKDISTKYTALVSKVMTDGGGRLKFPINEPADGLKKSQIQEFLDFYKSAGVQHIAVFTNDIVTTITELTSRGCEFLYVPGNYYDTVQERVGKIDEDITVLKKHGILVDKDSDGYLLQIFTKPVGDRPTLFFEILQRKGAQSFGKGNFKALFESIEEQQRTRGTLDH